MKIGPLQFLLGGICVLAFGLIMLSIGQASAKARAPVREIYIPEQYKAVAAKLYAEVYESAARNYAGPMGHVDKPADAAQQAVERMYGQ